MNPGKRRRYDYRRAVASRAEGGQLGDAMRALCGTAACISCTLVRPIEEMEHGVCGVCRDVRKSKPRRITHRPYFAARLEEGVVYVDASFRDGVAGLAVVGALGEHSARRYAQSSGQAEVFAMELALSLARTQRVDGLTFRTDSQSAERFGRNSIPKWADWTVEWVPRRQNTVADRVANGARLAA